MIPDKYTQKEMGFLNGAYICVGWASSVARLASRPVRIIVFDEVDKPGYYTTTKEAGPISLGVERTETFFNRRIFELSTPTDEDGNITRDLKSCDVIYDWHVPCPECGQYQPLRWSPENAHGFEGGRYRGDDGDMHRLGGVVWDGGLKASSRPNRGRRAMRAGNAGRSGTPPRRTLPWRRGKMVPRREPDRSPRKVGFHINRIYSLLGKSGNLSKLVDDWVRAHRAAVPKAIQGFINSAPWPNPGKTFSRTKRTPGKRSGITSTPACRPRPCRNRRFA